ncbi:hypothetical protein [Mycobacterium sp. GA-2829]|uniref:hypothetical protein n=1 Tax=Mycobacterium sp. GA-2829 TaxID=1772283 RepID=UPI000AFB6910|nr:hypothetical protein [Mycobacterium sp. GA-2829]
MGTRARTLTVAALLSAGLLAGCTQTVTGTVAQTTEPGPPIPDATSVTCKEYAGLAEDEQLAIVGELMKDSGQGSGSQRTVVAKTLADAICKVLPSAKLSDILVGR